MRAPAMGDGALRLHGGTDALGVPAHDFSTNSNACGPCPFALEAVARCDAKRYPDPCYGALAEQLAGFHGVDPARLLLAGSASEFIFRLSAWAARHGCHTVRVPQHSYGDYTHAARAWGLAVTTSGPADLQWYAEPSSPLGQSQRDDTRSALARLHVLDRAYEPLRLSGASAFTDAQLARVWQLWTPNKALGLTGVRAAYAIAPPGCGDAVAELKDVCASWPVGAHGVALLQAWVQQPSQAWLADSLGTLRRWKARQIAGLESLGWACLPSEANFFCADPRRADLDADLRGLRSHGIKLRNAASFGLRGHVRVSVLPPPDQDALTSCWEKMATAQGQATQ